MRIAVVNNFFPPRVGGSSHLSDSLAVAYADAGHDVLVISAAYRDARRDERRDGLRIVRLPAWSLPRLGTSIDFDVSFAFGPRNLRRLFRILDEFGPDVIHAHGQFLDLTWLASLYARRRRCPVLLSVHTRLESTRRRYDMIFRALDAVLVRPLIAIGRPRYVVMDRLMQDYISSRYHAPPNDMVAIPVGVRTTEPGVDTRERRESTRRVLGIAEQPMILSLGHVIPLRDRVALVESLPRVVERHPDVVVVVVGDINYPAFLERGEQLGVRDHIRCVGPVPRAEVDDFLAAADIEIHDLQGLGLGTASLEAMFAEVPVIAAVRPDNFPDIELRSGENITLVPLGDADALAESICELLARPERARQIALAQHELVAKHFSMTAVAELHLAELEWMATRPGPTDQAAAERLA